ncbi:hypothetical protein [Globicatella sulfidifaciens]|uniref:Uncharacterized protein n=1 Tax=Globicatella sulfidifaciens TaxID=136093 RepID=A0A7X8C3Z3_9LACT|nr:hypothetical protein [Globicatella sulfidifaciens]NLJ18364.1 hypothetical protein [Globicatella sulfidifaciens]
MANLDIIKMVAKKYGLELKKVENQCDAGFILNEKSGVSKTFVDYAFDGFINFDCTFVDFVYSTDFADKDNNEIYKFVDYQKTFFEPYTDNSSPPINYEDPYLNLNRHDFINIVDAA